MKVCTAAIRSYRYVSHVSRYVEFYGHARLTTEGMSVCTHAQT